jgi:uncharacterized protein involved in outer membrane biogenesis
MVLAFGFNLLLLLGASLYSLNDNDYRHALIWSADYFLDSQLEIDGAFSVSIGNEVEVNAEAVRLKANDGSYELSVGKLNVEQRFGSYLSTGTLWINHLGMDDLRAEIVETGTGQDFDWQTYALPFVVVEEIQLRKLSLAYTEIDRQRHAIELSHVSLDDTNNQGPVKVSAAGVMNARTLQLEGKLGSLEQLRSIDQSYPIELTLRSSAVEADSAGKQGRSVIQLDGTVGRTPSGSSRVDATFDVTVPTLVPIFSQQIRADKLGHLQGSLSIEDVGGRWGIRRIQLSARDTDAYQLSVDGTIATLLKFDLRSEFGVTDPAAFGARFGLDLAGYAPFKGKGLLSGNKDRISYQGNMKIGRIESQTELTALLTGSKPNIQGKLTVAELYLADIGIDQRLSMPVDAPIKASPDESEPAGPEALALVTDTPVKASPDESESAEPEALSPVIDTPVKASSDDSEPAGPEALAPVTDTPVKASSDESEPAGPEALAPVTDTPIKASSDDSEQAEPEALTSETDTSIKSSSDTSKTPTTATPAPAPGDSLPIFDREPMDLTGLQKFNLDLELSIDQITGADFSIDKLVGRVKLADGVLRVAPMRASFEGGSADLELAVDSRNTPSVTLKVTADDLLLAGVVPHAQPELQLHGKANLHIDITSKGRSVHDLVSALSGDVNLSLENVNLPRQYVEYLTADGVETPVASDAYTTLEIDGAVALKFGSEVEFSAETLHLRTNDGSYDLSLGKMNLQQSLLPLLETGDFSIHRLNIADMHVEIVESDTAADDPSDHDWHEFDFRVDDVPLVIIEKMQLSNLSLVYTTGDEQDTASLSSLVLDNESSEEPLTLSAAGMVNARTLKLEGSLGTPAEPRGKNQVYPVDYSLSSGTADTPPHQPVINFNGYIDRTQPGGAVIEGRFDVAVSELVSIFNQQIATDKLGHLQGSVNFSEVDGRWGIKKLDLASTGSDLYQLKLDGEADNSGKFELHSQLDVPDPAAFGAQLGLDFTGYAAYQGRAVITGNRSGFDYKGHWNLGRTENDTTLVISLVEGKPTIEGRFVIPDLYLPDIGINQRFTVDADADAQEKANPHHREDEKSEAQTPATAESLIVFPREPLDFSGLQHFNLDLEILIDDIIGVDYKIDKLDGRIKLTDGVLHISPMRMTFEGGTTDLDFLLDTRSTPSFTLKVLADDLELGRSIAEVQDVVPVEGKAHLNVDISGKGHSPHEMATDLSGEVSFSLENAKIPKVYIEFLSVDVMGWMARMVTFEDSYSTLHCTMTSFDIDQGVAKSKFLFADGPQLSIKGDATLDLGQETIDMTLFPTQKKRVTSSTSTVKITGALADPDVDTSTSKAGTAAVVGAAVLVPQVVVPVFLIEQLWKRVFSSDKGTGCADFIAEHAAQQQEEATQQQEEAGQ